MQLRKQPAPARERKGFRAGSEVPRTEVKIELPQQFYAVGNALNGMAQRKSLPAYRAIGRSLPSRLTVAELMIAARIAEGPFLKNPELFRARAIAGLESSTACAEFHRRGIFLDWHNLIALQRLFSQKGAEKAEICASQTRFIIRREAGCIIAEKSVRNTALASISSAVSLVHLRDMLQSCSISAAVAYANRSRTLRSPQMREIIQPMLEYAASEGENPKMGQLAQILSKRREGRTLVLCETPDQAGVLRARFPGVQVTNRPKAHSFAGIGCVILYSPTGHSVEAAWRAGVSDIVVLVAKGTCDEERYWQKAKTEDAKKKPGFGAQLLLF